MTLVVRLAIVVTMVAAFALARVAYRRWRTGVETDAPDVPSLPADLVAGADRTWVVFTTPWCASCDAVKAHLAAADPGARIVTVDATEDPTLAAAFHVRAAPTVVLADGAGTVQARYVGAAAVTSYLGTYGFPAENPRSTAK